MIKQVWIAQCDYCGKTERAMIKYGRYNEKMPILPIGWNNGYNKNFHLCPECYKRMLSCKQGE